MITPIKLVINGIAMWLFNLYVYCPKTLVHCIEIGPNISAAVYIASESGAYQIYNLPLGRDGYKCA
jgi:hypothetical protein